jgi:hypothetical protein
MEEMRNADKIFVGKSEEKRPLGRPRYRWEDNIIKHLWGIEWQDVEWMHLAQDTNQWRAVVNTVINRRVHKGQENS